MAKATAPLTVHVPIPGTDEECDRRIHELGENLRAFQQIELDLEADIAALKMQAEAESGLVTSTITALHGAIEAYCKAHRGRLTDDGKVKSYSFGNGDVAWRLAPPSVALKKVKNIIAWVLEPKSRKYRKFLRVKYEVDKEAMLRKPEQAAEIPGVTIKSGVEKFYVTPVGLELEQPK